MLLTDTSRSTLIQFYKDHADSIDLYDFNCLLESLGFDHYEPVQTVEVTVRFTVDVSNLEVDSIEDIDLSSASISLSSDSSYTEAYSDYDYSLDSISAV